jgi:predicted transcriptional regulator
MATSIKLDDALKERVHELARLRDRSPHWVMREAIRQYVDREEARESFYREALESWREYQETGLHLTGEEVARWLGHWGKAENEADTPDCHG